MGSCSRCGLAPVFLHLTNPVESYVEDVDACIAPIVQALNGAGVPTSESCCGHGEGEGFIFLQDGRTLRIEPPTPEQAPGEPGAEET